MEEKPVKEDVLVEVSNKGGFRARDLITSRCK
jgi:hypothetical protein